jgi:hypothetical protein
LGELSNIISGPSIYYTKDKKLFRWDDRIRKGIPGAITPYDYNNIVPSGKYVSRGIMYTADDGFKILSENMDTMWEFPVFPDRSYLDRCRMDPNSQYISGGNKLYDLGKELYPKNVCV